MIYDPIITDVYLSIFQMFVLYVKRLTNTKAIASDLIE